MGMGMFSSWAELRAALWGALGRGAAHREQLWELGRAVVGVRSPRYRGARSALPFPLTGAMKEALCAQPLPWPVRPSGCGMKRLFRRASALPAPGNRSRGGQPAAGRTMPLCAGHLGRPASVPTQGCNRLRRAGCSSVEVGGGGQDGPGTLRLDVPGWGSRRPSCPHSRCPHSRCPHSRCPPSRCPHSR